MLRLLNQPYPFSDLSIPKQLLRAGAIGIFVGLFLLVFQPFGLNLWETPFKALKLIGFGVITFGITFLHFYSWPRLLKNVFRDEHWTVGKEILHITTNILLIAIANHYYLVFLTNDVHGIPDLTSSILITFLIGIFPTAGSVIVNYIIQLKKYSQTAAHLPIHPHNQSAATSIDPVGQPIIQKTNTASTIRLTAENEKDVIVIHSSDDLLFIESSDNYCTVYYLKDKFPTKTLLRSSLGRLEAQLKLSDTAHQPFVRCHRSYVVNLDQVEHITGNAQGYKLHLLNDEFQVPVARKYNDSLIAELKRTT